MQEYNDLAVNRRANHLPTSFGSRIVVSLSMSASVRGSNAFSNTGAIMMALWF
jgi:hypothetical protein